jgi:hypothetical protein
LIFHYGCVTSATNYLGTIALEDVLPLRQWYQRWLVLKQTIPKYIRLPASGVDASEIVSEYDCITKTYQNEQIYSILGDIVQTVAALKIFNRNNEVK